MLEAISPHVQPITTQINDDVPILPGLISSRTTFAAARIVGQPLDGGAIELGVRVFSCEN